MTQIDPQVEAAKASELEGFLRIKRLEAQLALYRGYLHEVNNALAGIGTLAEMLKGAGDKGGSAKPSEKNLELMVNATQRSATLQRRIRALYTDSDIAFDIEVSEFLEENKDLMELMLPHSQRLSFAIAPGVPVNACVHLEKLWEFVSLMLLWYRETNVSRAQVIWTHQGSLRLQLNTEALPREDAAWRELLERVGHGGGGRVSISAKGIDVSFGKVA